MPDIPFGHEIWTPGPGEEEDKECSKCGKTPAYLAGLAFNGTHDDPQDMRDIYLCQQCNEDICKQLEDE